MLVGCVNTQTSYKFFSKEKGRIRFFFVSRDLARNTWFLAAAKFFKRLDKITVLLIVIRVHNYLFVKVTSCS